MFQLFFIDLWTVNPDDISLNNFTIPIIPCYFIPWPINPRILQGFIHRNTAHVHNFERSTVCLKRRPWDSKMKVHWKLQSNSSCFPCINRFLYSIACTDINSLTQFLTQLTLKVLNFWKFTSYCSLKPLWLGMGEVVPALPARTLPTLHPPSPPTMHQLSRLAL